MVTRTNIGLENLVWIASTVLPNCDDRGLYEAWRERRWDVVMDRLTELNEEADVASFICSYADSLADDLLRLSDPSDGVYPADTAAAAAEYFEELLTQAEFMAKSAKLDRPEEGVQLLEAICDSSDSHPDIGLAMAA